MKFGHESLHLDNAFYRLRPKLSASQARFSKDNFSSEAGTEMGKKEFTNTNPAFVIVWLFRPSILTFSLRTLINFLLSHCTVTRFWQLKHGHESSILVRDFYILLVLISSMRME